MYPLDETVYAKLVKTMASEPAIASTLGRRNGYEQTYYDHHHALGIRLRAKYRRR